MSEEYKFTTIRDIFETVPVEKIPTCLKELGQLMVQAKHMDNAMCMAAELVSGKEHDKAFEWPEPVTWIDDGKGEIEARYMMPDNDEPLITTKMVLKEAP